MLVQSLTLMQALLTKNALKILEQPIADSEASSEEVDGDQYASETDRTKAAISALETMSNKHSSSNVSIIASMRAGQLAIDVGDYEKALTLFKGLEGHVKGNDPLQAQVLLGLGFARRMATKTKRVRLPPFKDW